MLSDLLKRKIRAAVKANEIGAADPYSLSFARKGNSGASFGATQSDVSSNLQARGTLSKALRINGATEEQRLRIVNVLSMPHKTNPLTAEDTMMASDALRRSSAMVDEVDGFNLETVHAGIERCMDANPTISISQPALLFMALWINMTGPPSLILSWIRSQTMTIFEVNIAGYLKAQKYFIDNPLNFQHMADSVAEGMQCR